MQTLSKTSVLTVLFDPPTRVATLKRSSLPAESPGLLEQEWMTALLMLSQLEVRSVLVDSREAAGRNSSAYEEVMVRVTNRITNMFPRCAVLVRTATGALQARRMLSPDAISGVGPLLISDDLQECLRFLQGPAAALGE